MRALYAPKLAATALSTSGLRHTVRCGPVNSTIEQPSSARLQLSHATSPSSRLKIAVERIGSGEAKRSMSMAGS